MTTQIGQHTRLLYAVVRARACNDYADKRTEFGGCFEQVYKTVGARHVSVLYVCAYVPGRGSFTTSLGVPSGADITAGEPLCTQEYRAQ